MWTPTLFATSSTASLSKVWHFLVRNVISWKCKKIFFWKYINQSNYSLQIYCLNNETDLKMTNKSKYESFRIILGIQNIKRYFIAVIFVISVFVLFPGSTNNGSTIPPINGGRFADTTPADGSQIVCHSSRPCRFISYTEQPANTPWWVISGTMSQYIYTHTHIHVFVHLLLHTLSTTARDHGCTHATGDRKLTECTNKEKTALSILVYFFGCN